MIFLTVGSMFPFDRLVRAVDGLVGHGLIADDVKAQIGNGRYEPKHLPFERFLAKPAYEQRVHDASALIAHAGAGTIGLALADCKPLLVLPRRRSLGEHVNDHQVVTARKFGQLGHVLVAWEAGDIAGLLAGLGTFAPRPRVVDRKRMVRRIDQFMAALPQGRRI